VAVTLIKEEMQGAEKSSMRLYSVIVVITLVILPELIFGQGVPNGDEFTFVRLQYSSGEGYDGWNGRRFRRRRSSWAVDYPFAERNFMRGLESFTALNVADEPVALSILDEEFFRYPFVYAVEVGYMALSEEEAQTLREWFLRGGFLMVDDFHGQYEWLHFSEQMLKVFPNRPIVQIPIEHPIFHCYFEVNELHQIPGLGAWRSGRTHEKGGIQQHCMGIFDDGGRLMVLVMHNMDMGDAWEHTNDPRYPEWYAAQAYKLGINFVIYALTH
jgi:hypothetical protein